MKRSVPSDHITVWRTGLSKTAGWSLGCRICGCSVITFRNPLEDGYLVWFRGRHFECLPKTSRISALDDLWLDTALRAKARKPRQR